MNNIFRTRPKIVVASFARHQGREKKNQNCCWWTCSFKWETINWKIMMCLAHFL